MTVGGMCGGLQWDTGVGLGLWSSCSSLQDVEDDKKDPLILATLEGFCLFFEIRSFLAPRSVPPTPLSHLLTNPTRASWTDGNCSPFNFWVRQERTPNSRTTERRDEDKKEPPNPLHWTVTVVAPSRIPAPVLMGDSLRQSCATSHTDRCSSAATVALPLDSHSRITRFGASVGSASVLKPKQPSHLGTTSLSKAATRPQY